MSRRFKDMQTEEQRYAQEAAARPHRPAAGRPVSNREWRSMDAYEQAAHLAREAGKEAEARRHEEARAERLNPPKKRRWF